MMSEERVAVGFSATEAFHKQADEYARRLGMTRATFIATVVEFALNDKEFFLAAFMERARREVSLAWAGGELYSVGPRTKSVQLLLPKSELKRLDAYAERMKKSRSEVLATLAEEGFEAQRIPIELALQPWFGKFVKALETAGAFVDVLPSPT
jgi:hypothetical protein